MQYEVVPYGESAFLMKFKEEISLEVHLQVKASYQQLQKINFKGITSLIPAYNSLTVVFNANEIDRSFLKLFLEKTKFHPNKEQKKTRIVEVPVCYEAPYSLDMQEVAKKTGLTPQEIIKIHTSKPYLVYMLGFAPGFMYLGGLDARLFTPRKETPRVKIQAGAVGLADQQTGIYPLETPGGWQIIGQTPLTLFSKKQAAIAQMGDAIQFVSISTAEFQKIKAQ